MTKPDSPLVEKTQCERFIETARELGADTDAEALDTVFGKVVPPVVPEPPKKKQKSGSGVP